MRQTLNINSNWKFHKGDLLPSSFPLEWEEVTLPHTYNAIDGMDGGNDYYRGKAVYCKVIEKPAEDVSVILEVNAAATVADVYLNGKHLCTHRGGYSAFRVDLSEELKSENLLCIVTDNSPMDDVYPQKADFTFYGGLYRDVNLLLVPQHHFECIKDGSLGVKVTPKVEGSSARVIVESWQNSDKEVRYTVGNTTAIAQSVNGYATAELVLPDVHLWNGTEDPYLYTLTAEVEDDMVEVRFGCRTMEISPEKGFILNGKVTPLRGVSRHQDRLGKGSAISYDDMKEDLSFIQSIGANSVRLAHYQHDQKFYDLCDEAGIIVWAEIPYITQHLTNGKENTLSQMKEMVTQLYHHPSIAVWGLSNEISAASAVNEELLNNHKELNDLAHKLDATRPTTMAHVFMLETDSPLTEIPDVGAYNLYYGWYLGALEQNEEFFDEYHAKFPNRAIGFSEYGADANPAFHSIKPERGDYTEEYQCVYHEHMLKMIEERPYLWCTYVWNMFDFGADGRDEGGKNGLNQKGLVTADRKICKDAFYLYKAYWSKEPFVHLCSKRYVKRHEEATQIKVYSNLPEVSLYVNDELVETKQGNRVFIFDMAMSKMMKVKAVAGECCDEMVIEKVDAPEASYRMLQAEVVNWFDQSEIDPAYFSIKDTMGEIMQDPQAGPIVGAMMEQMSARRGDVAQSVKGNANLQKMMARMTMESLLKSAGEAVSKEQIEQLNRLLQSIPKQK